MDSVETVVVGAGVVGLAVARRLALAGQEVLILEAEEDFAWGTTSRNSEVIHAGIYYPKGSLKAVACVAGRDALYRFCADRGIAHQRLGKLIVAVDETELPGLEALQRSAEANGVDDLRRLDRDETRALEPALTAAGALHSPSTGILDSHAFCLALLGEAEAAGAMLVCRSPVEALRKTGSGFEVAVGGAEPMALACRRLVNAAGLGALGLAGGIEGIEGVPAQPERYAKGNYFTLRGRAPFRHLIYPVPVAGGLGTHLCLALAGRVRFGPDVEWVEAPDYNVDPARAETFYQTVRRWWPELPDDSLQPDFAGIRPKIVGPGEPAGDFQVQGKAVHGLEGLVNLFGIESPGLTASLALAERVAWELGASNDPLRILV